MQPASISYHPVPNPKRLVSYALAGVELKVLAVERRREVRTLRVTSDNILRIRRNASLEEVEYALYRASIDAPASFYCDPIDRTIGVACELDDDGCDLNRLIANCDLVVAQSIPELHAIRMN